MIERSEFERLIPHNGSMCLIDRVLEWDDSSIHCATVSHCNPDNPLQTGSQLAAVHLIEYGAQSMAIHGALLARAEGRSLAPGYLAGLKFVKFNVTRLDNIEEEMYLSAEQLVRQGNSVMYQFCARTNRADLGGGRITVIESRSGQ